MTTVYAADRQRCAVKITSRGDRQWKVYGLDEVRCARKDLSVVGSQYSGCEFKWQPKPFSTSRYPPFEHKDVVEDPAFLLKDVVRRCSNRVRYDPFMARRRRRGR